MDLALTGKSVLITGASQGIGAGLAKAFAAEGCKLSLTARNAERLERLKAEIADEFDGAVVAVHPLDLTQSRAVEDLTARAGDIDILVNNAGVIPSGTVFDVDEAKWREGWELKVFGYINLCRLYYPRMKAAGGGVIINNIGNGGEISDPRYTAGSVGNASLMMFTRSMGGQSLDDNIRVVAVNPGPIDTDRIYNMLRKRARDLFDDDSLCRASEAVSFGTARVRARGGGFDRLPCVGSRELCVRNDRYGGRRNRFQTIDHLTPRSGGWKRAIES